jgi:hypothetical protein
MMSNDNIEQVQRRVRDHWYFEGCLPEDKVQNEVTPGVSGEEEIEEDIQATI